MTQRHTRTPPRRLSRQKKFIQYCCHVRHYVFGIKKCWETNCTMQICTRHLQDTPGPFLPDPLARGDHYVPFKELYGVPTTERDRPLMKTIEGRGEHGIQFSPNNQTASNVSQCVLCAECLRPRVLHSLWVTSYWREH